MKNRILIVDDHPEITKIMVKAIKRFIDCDIEVFHDGSKAVEAIIKPGNRFDLYISDFEIGDGAGGAEVIAAAKKMSPGSPTMIVSGALAYKSAEINACGADVVLSKPFEVVPFISAIKKLLEIE